MEHWGDVLKDLDELSDHTADTISSSDEVSFYSTCDEMSEVEEKKKGGDYSTAISNSTQHMESLCSTQPSDLLSVGERLGAGEGPRRRVGDPPSFYHFLEMNKSPVIVAPRSTNAVPSQYQMPEMRDFAAIDTNAYLLKMATCKEGASDEPPPVSAAFSHYVLR